MTPQYRQIPCPACGTVAFSFTPEGWRKCWRCGHLNSDPAGREVIGWRGPSNGFKGGSGFRQKVHRESHERSAEPAVQSRQRVGSEEIE